MTSHFRRGWIVALLMMMLVFGVANAQTNVTLTFWTFVSDHADFYESMVEAFNESQTEYKITLANDNHARGSNARQLAD